MKLIKPTIFKNFSYSRDSVASYYDENGLIAVADVDELRYGYDPETLEYAGAIFEEEAFNELTYSNNFAGAGWFITGDTPVITPAATISPDGTNNATKVESSAGYFFLQHTVPVTGYRTFSVYLKAAVPGCNVLISIGSSASFFYINTDNYHASSANSRIKKLPNGWFRCEIDGRVTSTVETLNVQIKGNSGLPFYIFGAQLENLTSPGKATSYIATTSTSVTRAKDLLSDPPSILSSNIPEDDNSEWLIGTAYSAGSTVMVLGEYHKNYKSLSGGNLGNFPPDNPTQWLDIGSTNRWRMFNMKTGADLQSTLEGDIDFSVTIDGLINTVCLFNVEGLEAILTVYFNGEVYYTKTIDLVSEISEPSWYSYYFETRRLIKEVVFLDVPPVSSATIRIQITGSETTGYTRLGKVVMGNAFDLGFAEFGSTSIGITDYSVKEEDEFGNYYVLERRYVGRVSVKTVVDPGNEISTRDALAEVRATASAYIIDTTKSTIVSLGFYKDFDILFSTPDASYCSLNLEGI